MTALLSSIETCFEGNIWNFWISNVYECIIYVLFLSNGFIVIRKCCSDVCSHPRQISQLQDWDNKELSNLSPDVSFWIKCFLRSIINVELVSALFEIHTLTLSLTVTIKVNLFMKRHSSLFMQRAQGFSSRW